MKRPTQLLLGPYGRLRTRGVTVAAATVCTIALLSALAANASPFKIVRTEGGISPAPVLTSIKASTNKNVTLTWQAFSYQVPIGSNVTYKITRCPGFQGTNTAWTAVTSVTNLTSVTTPADSDVGLFTVQQDPAPLYAGADTCMKCHDDTHAEWLTTAHAGALDALKGAHSDKNASCLPCHTVGYGTPNGYVDEATTPQLAGVQCENCHGPAGAHAQKPLDKAKRPVKTLAAEMCGGCHTGIHDPQYDEFATSTHGTTQIPEEEFADPTNGPPRMLTCGACHSAATRLALLAGVEEMQANPGVPFAPELPDTEAASTTGITCVACHDPHLKTENGVQLRFPMASKVPYSYNTGTNFAANYNDQVQTCAQCHNMRGATWTATSRGPHHSPQYNVLIGNGGYEGGSTNVPQSAHMDIPTQCVQCHVHTETPATITAATPNVTGHTFNPTMQACAPCHDELGATLITTAVQSNVKQQMSEIKGLLDQWAMNKAPDALRQKYGGAGWEFGVLGSLSTPPAGVTAGPNATEQKLIPDAIKQARYNLYLVENDHSYGVHNGNYTRFLLQVARDKANSALNAQ